MLKSRFRITDQDDTNKEKREPKPESENDPEASSQQSKKQRQRRRRPQDGDPEQTDAEYMENTEYMAEEEIAGEGYGEGSKVPYYTRDPRLPPCSERRLNRSEVSVRLSLLGKTAEGDGYTYLKATLTNLKLTEISAIRSFQHLQFLDVSNNNIEQNALQVISGLPFLVLIQADQNLLISAALPKMKYLQVIIMNSNYLTSVRDVYQPELSTLEVGNNEIKRIQFDNKMPSIRCLDFRNNLLQEITDLDFPILDSLYLAGNKITSLDGVGNLVNLRILHVRSNPIKLLDGFTENNKKLEYLNLRGCKVKTLKQVTKLKVLTGLQTLVMKGCPYMGEDEAAGEDDAGLRTEMIATLPWLKRINKDAVSPEERTEGKDLMLQWLEEGREDEEEMPEEVGAEEEN